MEINKNSKTFLYVGLIVSIVAGICSYVILNKAENLVPVIVARKTIEPRTLIKEDMIQIEKVSALNRKANALDDTELVVGGFSTVKIFEGQDILQPMVAKQFDERGSSELSLAIPDENLRAISYPLTKINSMSNTLKKGDFVDIIATAEKDKLGTDTSITKTILQGVEVFNIDNPTSSTEAGAITFLLTLEQIEIVNHAFSIGEVKFALNPSNAKPVKTSGVVNKTFCERFNFNCAKTK